MKIGANDLLVLDTNVLIHWTRQDATGQQLKSSLMLDRRTERPLVPTTVEGEIRGLAKVRSWGGRKLQQLNEIFRELVRIEVGLPEVIECYAEIYSLDRQGGHCTGQNDMWIAAATMAVGGVLVTCDDDFHWMHPNRIRVCHVAQA